MIQANYTLTPLRQDDENEDRWTTLKVSPIVEPGNTEPIFINISVVDDGPGGSGNLLAALELDLEEAGELASVLKILAKPGGPHSTADLASLGLQT
jgi:hypothetical protein